MKNKITFIRRISQIIFFILIIYGAFIFKTEDSDKTKKNFMPKLKAPPGSISTTQFKKGQILWPSGDVPVLENYPPTLICRFNPKGGLFKACILHFFSENFTWRTPIKYLLPHITLFMVLCFIFGRMWCGWVCPIGATGDLLTFLRRKMNKPLKRFKKSARKSLRYSSYGLLSLSIAISTIIGLPAYSRFQCYWFLPYCQVCPARLLCPLFGFINPTWKDFTSRVSACFTIIAWIFLGLFIAAFYWGRRVWCHLCPVGLMNSWFNKGCAIELNKTASKCNKCGSCADSCPMGLTKMYRESENVKYNEKGCIMCFKCIDVCPRNGCLSVSILGKKITESKY